VVDCCDTHIQAAPHRDWIEIRDLESRNGTYVNGQRPSVVVD
jgi:pSer/pThr/pTyr-binding forkhead associated (FHA) protein